MHRTIKFNFPLPSTIFLFIVLTMIVAFPNANSLRGTMIALLGAYLLFLMFVNRGPIHWVHVLWVVGFYVFSELSQEWALIPSGAQVVVSNILYSMILNWSLGEYVYQGKRSFSHIAAVMAAIALLMLGNLLLNSTVLDGRYYIGSNANVMGMNGAYLFGFLLYGAKEAKWKKIHLNILAALVAVVTVLTGSRKALLMLVLFFAGYFFFWKPEKNMGKFVRRLIVMACICAVVIFLLMKVEVLYDAIGNRLESLYLQWIQGEGVDNSATTRERMIAIGMDMFQRAPIFGSGHNTFKFYSGYNTYSHNNYVELLVSVGVVGLLLYYLPLLYFTFQAMKLWRKGVPGAIVPLIILLTQFLNDVGQVSYYAFYIHIYLGIAVGYVYLMKKQLKEKEAGEEVLWDIKGRRLK